MIHCGIYLIRNKITNKVYVGRAVNISRRWSEHRNRMHDPNTNCYDKPLYRSMRKHGLENFEFTILEDCPEDKLREREAYYIQKYNCVTPNGYNVADEGEAYLKTILRCKVCGNPITATSKTGLCHDCYSKSIRTCIWPSKEELYELLKNNSFNAVGRMYNVNANTVKKWCIKYGIPSHASDYRDIHKFVDIPIYQYSLNGEFIAEFPNARVAAKVLGIKDASDIYECLYDRKHSCNNYQWKTYKKDKIDSLYGQIGTIYSGKRFKCVETGEIFDSVKDAMAWCGLKSNSSIYTSCAGKGNAAGKHPLTGEKLHWEYA